MILIPILIKKSHNQNYPSSRVLQMLAIAHGTNNLSVICHASSSPSTETGYRLMPIKPQLDRCNERETRWRLAATLPRSKIGIRSFPQTADEAAAKVVPSCLGPDAHARASSERPKRSQRVAQFSTFSGWFGSCCTVSALFLTIEALESDDNVFFIPSSESLKLASIITFFFFT